MLGGTGFRNALELVPKKIVTRVVEMFVWNRLVLVSGAVPGVPGSTYAMSSSSSVSPAGTVTGVGNAASPEIVRNPGQMLVSKPVIVSA